MRQYVVIDWNTTSRRAELDERPVQRFQAVNSSVVNVPESAIIDSFHHLIDAVQAADILNRDTGF